MNTLSSKDKAKIILKVISKVVKMLQKEINGTKKKDEK